MKQKIRATAARGAALLAALVGGGAVAGVVTPLFAVNTYTAGAQHFLDSASSINGDSLVLWRDDARGGYAFLRRYDGAGTPIDASEWYAGTGVESAAIDKVGNFALASVEVDGSGRSVFISVYNRAGTSRLARFRANSTPANHIGGPRLAINGQGQMVVFWLTYRSDGLYGMVARTFSLSGVPTSPETLVTPPSVSNLMQGVRIDDAGNFAAVWLNGTASSDVYFRRFSNAGSPLTPPTLVNTYTTGAQANASLAMNGSGSAVAIYVWVSRMSMDPAGTATLGWRNYSSADANYDAYALRFAMDTQPAVATLTSGVAVSGLSSAQFGWKYFKVVVPPGRSTLRIQLSGPGTGNADIYGNLGVLPTLARAEVRSTAAGNNEGLVITGAPPGVWYFGIHGASAYSGVTLTVTSQ